MNEELKTEDMEATLEKIQRLEVEVFGKTSSDQTSEELAWAFVRPDNFLISTLKDLTGLYAQAVEKQAQAVEKDIKAAQKVFYGR